jgi:putative SOS response-associated peptidase YedK
MINARSETLSEKPVFRNAFKKRRCLIPANGYYEWRGEKGNKQPWYITFETGTPFVFAGLWERWIDPRSPDSAPLDSCTIVTTEAIASIRHIHDRMPLIPAPEHYESWLDPNLEDAGELNRILQAGSVRELAFYPVSKSVNSVKSGGPDLIQRIAV